MAKERAIEYYEAGRKDEAVQVLRRNQQQLLEANASFDAPMDVLEAEAANVYDQSTTLENEGLDNRSRKVMRTEAEQNKNQQKNTSSWWRR